MRSRVNEVQEDWKPTFLTNEEFTHLVLEAVDGFIIVFSTSGTIFYVSESITSLLGHLPVSIYLPFHRPQVQKFLFPFKNDVLNMTIYEMATEEEQNTLYSTLLNPSEEEGQVSFSCHLRRGDRDPKQPDCYELVHFVGYFRKYPPIYD